MKTVTKMIENRAVICGPNWIGRSTLVGLTAQIVKWKDASSSLAKSSSTSPEDAYTVLSRTPARKKFKEHLGQANHFLITLLVGLDALERSTQTEAPPDMNTSWNPRDRGISINRSRVFAHNAFLGWAVDSIDMYISLLNRRPFCVGESVRNRIDGCGHSVKGKVDILSEAFSITDNSRYLVDILITWRNNVFHELCDKAVSDHTRRRLDENAEAISRDYCHLNIKELPTKALEADSLTFKETTSLIKATHKFVEVCDRLVLEQLDCDKYYCEAVEMALQPGNGNETFIRKFKSLDDVSIRRYLRTWLMNNYGVTQVSDEDLILCLDLR